MTDQPISALAPSRPTLRRDPDLDFLVVIPTCGDPAILVPTVKRVLEHAEPRTCIVLSVNPTDAAKAAEAVAACRALPDPSGVGGGRLVVVTAPGPIGFARAVNAGLRGIEASGGLATLNVILNDDTRVTAGWLRGLQAAADSSTVRVPAEPAIDENGTRADRPASAYGRIGLVGPVSDRVAGLQSVNVPKGSMENLDAFAANHRLRAAGEVLCADFLSGFCVGVRYEALVDLVDWAIGNAGWLKPDAGADLTSTPLLAWSLFDERFAIGGFEDNDLCVRAELSGWRCAIAGEVFIHHLGHQTLDKYPGQMRGMANRLTYYQKWANDPRVTGKRLVTAFRVKLETVQDIHYWRTALARLAPLADGVAVLLTNNPLDVQASYDWNEVQGLPPSDQQLLQDCSNADAAGVERAVLRWVERTWTSARGARLLSARVDVWAGAFNERDERNRMIEIAESLGADWILSVDHDEVVEPRIDRAYMERLMTHPDPMIRSWDCGWVNLWDSPRLVRQDAPWGDNGTFRGGMRGFRLWRVSKAAPRRILSGNAIGLHCGNAPMHDPVACRVSAIRFRHFGYLNVRDRYRKYERYTSMDPNPDIRLTGGGYGHLVAEEGMRTAPFVAQDGVGLSMLVHGGEKVEDVARHLDVLHGVVDHAVLVWTDPVDAATVCDGVNTDLVEFAHLFGSAIVHQPLDEDFAAARNAGLDYLRQWAVPGAGRAPTLGWVWSVDPDEHLQDWFSDTVAIRRMAECSDAYGFMVRFANLRPAESGEAPTMSETIRLVRIDPGNLMRWHGRIHEGFDRALNAVLAAGVKPMLRTCPFVVVNPGLGGDDYMLERKTRLYQKLLVRELEDDPNNPGAWVALGMQFTNDGLSSKAVECFHRAVACDGEGYLPYRELMLHHLRAARALAGETMRLVHEGHPYHQIARECLQWLRVNAPEQPLIGLARRGEVPPEADVPLPWHPAADGPKPEREADPTSRTAEILCPDGTWAAAPYDAIRAGDVVRIFESDGTPVNGGEAFRALTAPVPGDPNGYIETEPYFFSGGVLPAASPEPE
jgi:GT2 family glycosyltransferase